MKKQNGKNINCFIEGDIITRIESIVKTTDLPFVDYHNSNSEIKIDIIPYDNSYRGEPLKFLLIANNMIYLHPMSSEEYYLSQEDENYMISLPLEIYENGWDYYVNPKEMLKINFNIKKQGLKK